MRTQRELYPGKTTVYTCELERCPVCNGMLEMSYTSGSKTVQTMNGVLVIAQRTKRCSNLECVGRQVRQYSAQWRQIAPVSCTYGYDVIAQIGWQRQIGQ